MRITKIQLKNGYKRFHNLTIELGSNPKKIIALVGPNGSGKSCVFDGMLFLANDYRNIGKFGNKDNNFHSMTGSKIGRESIIIEYDSREDFEKVWLRKQSAEKEMTIFSFRNSYRFNSNLNISEQKAMTDIKQNSYGASSSVDLDDKMTENYQRLVIYLNKYRKENDLTDKQAIDQVIGELNRILENCLGLKLVDEGDIMAGRGTLYFKKNNQLREFTFNVLSSGEKEVVDLFLDMYLKREDYSETIYIIDEPELHLNTSIQKKVLIEVAKLIPDGCQIWIATHSIGFLNALQNELSGMSDIIDFDGDFSSTITVLSPMKKTRENWQKIFKTALEDLTGLLAPSIIIYCEGKHLPSASGDEQGLDAEVYNTIFSETFPEVLFVSSGGSTEPDKYASIALTVLNKAFKDAELLILKDKDINGDGSPTTNDQRDAFLLKNPKMHRMLKRKEIENYLFDFEILNNAYGLNKIDYDAVIPNIQEDVKSKMGNLMSLCGIKKGMNGENFKKHLSTFITTDTNVFKELEESIFQRNNRVVAAA